MGYIPSGNNVIPTYGGNVADVSGQTEKTSESHAITPLY
jgi:hypothetical protein